MAHYPRIFCETLAKEVEFVTSPGSLVTEINKQILKSTITYAIIK